MSRMTIGIPENNPSSPAETHIVAQRTSWRRKVARTAICLAISAQLASRASAVLLTHGTASITLDLTQLAPTPTGLSFERFYGLPGMEAASLSRNELVTPSGPPHPDSPTSAANLPHIVNGAVTSPNPSGGGVRYRQSTTLNYDPLNVLGSWAQPTPDPFYVLADGEQIGLDGVMRMTVAPDAGGGVFLYGDYALRYAPARATIPPGAIGLVLTSNFDFPNYPLVDLANPVITATPTSLSLSADLLLSYEYTFFFGGVTGANVGHIDLTAFADLAGDFNRDRSVDGGDLLLWQREFGNAAVPAGASADGNADGLVNSLDLVIWTNSFGMVNAAAAVRTVPEPTSAALLFCGLFGTFAGSRMRIRTVDTTHVQCLK